MSKISRIEISAVAESTVEMSFIGTCQVEQGQGNERKGKTSGNVYVVGAADGIKVYLNVYKLKGAGGLEGTDEDGYVTKGGNITINKAGAYAFAEAK